MEAFLAVRVALSLILTAKKTNKKKGI